MYAKAIGTTPSRSKWFAWSIVIVSTAFLPVLRSQAAAVEELIDQRYGKLRVARSRGVADPAGRAGGRMAADNARLTFGDLERTG